tara:strand:- start:278 stop:889 length:612 start_codon:yes stop_codon:yes gene_type:complete
MSDENLYALFGDPLYISPSLYNLNENELKFIKELEKRQETSHTSSRNDYILEEKELQGIKKYCQEWVEKYAYEVLCIERDIEFYITQSWSNYLDTNVNHHMHSHPNSIISGVFYVQTDGTPIQFYRGSSVGSFLLHLGFSENNEWNSDCVHFTSEANKVFLFPSSLYHAVSVNQSNTERISIAFNTFVKGDLGKGEAYTRLVL